jgi:hypothetical protein
MTWITPEIISFLRWCPPLQRGVVGPYPIRVVWFSNRLLLEGTDRIQNFGP